jgi:hypothetical protein
MSLKRLISAIDAWTGFDRWGPDTNPLMAQLKRQPSRLSLRALLWLAFGLGILGLAAATGITVYASASDLSTAERIVTVSGWAFYLAAPFITAAGAASGTRRAVRVDHYEVIWLTPLSNTTLVRAHVFAALYRARYMLGGLVALMPFLIVEVFHAQVALQAHLYFYAPDPPTYWEGVVPALLALVVVMGLWGLVFLGAAIGVRMALLRRDPHMAVVAALALTGGSMLCPCLCGGLVAPDFLPSPAVVIVILPLLAAIPYVVAIGTLEGTANAWPR